MSKKTVCLDFDGVMNTYTGWKGEKELFEPREGLKDFLFNLNIRGWSIVVHSTRQSNRIYEWLKKHSLEEVPIEVVDKKPPAMAYVDDRGIRFDGDFNVVLNELEGFQPFWAR
jgi:hypothetical protein